MMYERPRNDLNREIVQLALMRGCWSRSESVFEQRLQAICDDWAGGRQETSKKLCRRLLDGRQVAAELSFVTKPLVNMLAQLRAGREQVDAGLRLAIAADPLASNTGVMVGPPPGYLSWREAADYLGCEPNNLIEASRIVAYARSVRVIAVGKQGPPQRYFAEQDVEAAKLILEEQHAERDGRRMARLAKRRIAPIDAIPVVEVAKRIGRTRYTVSGAISEKRFHSIPTMHRFGSRWFSFEADIIAFLAKRTADEERIAQLRAEGYIDTRAAAFLYGKKQDTFIEHCRKWVIRPIRIGHHAFYAPADVELLKREQENERQLRQQEKRRQRRATARAKAIEQKRIKPPPPPLLSGIPSNGIPIREVCYQIRMRRKRLGKIMAGLSGTPIPRVHRAENGHLYCLPEDLAAFRTSHPERMLQ
jgi:sRNA-binding protein